MKFAGLHSVSLFLLGVLLFLPLHLLLSSHHGFHGAAAQSSGAVCATGETADAAHHHCCPSVHESFVVRNVCPTQSELLPLLDVPLSERDIELDTLFLFPESEPLPPSGVTSSRIRFSLALVWYLSA